MPPALRQSLESRHCKGYVNCKHCNRIISDFQRWQYSLKYVNVCVKCKQLELTIRELLNIHIE